MYNFFYSDGGQKWAGEGVDSYAVVVARLVGQVIVIVVVSIFYEARRIFTELVVPILGSVISQ